MRNAITTFANTAVDDGGNTLFTLAIGEQLEFPVALNFLSGDLSGLTFEAVVIEAENLAGQTSAPKTVAANAAKTKLNVRVPTYRGNWQGDQAYSMEDIVVSGGVYYARTVGVNIVSPSAPNVSSEWVVADPRVVYIQSPMTLGSDWKLRPGVDFSV